MHISFTDPHTGVVCGVGGWARLLGAVSPLQVTRDPRASYFPARPEERGGGGELWAERRGLRGGEGHRAGRGLGHRPAPACGRRFLS